ncbi:uncharacterized protein Z518_08428 [Rhinocladiella mackenziei CBS 650.93]|uniref:Rhinocladiella mackenziei CBS 650.93 unplaced genomic scaffold supercont1.6, whole genome shotgun sequence n=1 Tax=Rhinocladiella mackenziei CBS 650.93 TaxID=1442369 RepID=A0A0D2FKP0_9EURO|nr:uncharacterized protein Z518_08428 [Rhinocladiella mackenziei CBS 650.93]KIX02487.1 hypothetical protein Z518_08428 [Rhinocladiella mackenziei CBS 650.93]
MVALSMADGYARLTGKPQCVIVHVDVGTQSLGAGVHNASAGRSPVLIFAGLSPYTVEGELCGSRTEYIHWIQDVPDQKQIVAQYCRYSGEIKTGRNVKQMVHRALQFATNDPPGPVYLVGARETMAEEIEPYWLDQSVWKTVGPAALPPQGVESIAKQLIDAERPLLITGYSGRNHAAVPELIALADTMKGLRVLVTDGSDLCFPFSHRASLGMKYGVDDDIPQADFILVVDCDVPWIPTQCRPNDKCKIVHVDIDPLKNMMPVFYLPAVERYKADATTAFKQLHTCLSRQYGNVLDSEKFDIRWMKLGESHAKRLEVIQSLAAPPEGGALSSSYVCAEARKLCPDDTIWTVEAVTETIFVADQIQAEAPGSWINQGGGGLGWSGGASLGIKLASDAGAGGPGKGKFVCQIVGDGSYLFSFPGSVYWIAQRYNIPTLTVVLNNKGWNAPRRSLLLVHADGEGSRSTNEELNLSFEPSPDYAGIAKAASGGKMWAGRATSVDEFSELLPEAIKSVKEGTGAVLEVRLKDKDTVPKQKS